MFSKVCNCSNLTDAIIETLRNGTFQDLTLDMTAFAILRHLTEKQREYEQIDQDAFEVQDLKNIAEFIGKFFRTFHWVDSKPMFSYLLNRISNK